MKKERRIEQTEGIRRIEHRERKRLEQRKGKGDRTKEKM
jgi:hypothetical protein